MSSSDSTPSATKGPAVPDTAALCRVKTKNANSGGGGIYNGNWLQRGSDAPELLVRAGQTAPGTGGASFSNVLYP